MIRNSYSDTGFFTEVRMGPVRRRRGVLTGCHAAFWGGAVALHPGESKEPSHEPEVVSPYAG